MHLNFLRGGTTSFGGRGYVAGESPGLVTVAGVAASRPVCAFERESSQLCGWTTSAADGSWRIDGLSIDREFYIVAFDTSGQFNAVIRDRVTPVPMT